jgi:hypothetical protein
MGQAQSRQCSPKHRSAHNICVRGLFNLQICVVYGVDELDATVRSDGKGQYASGLANLGAVHIAGQLHALAA